jgi:hypothetical protein
MPCYLIPTKDGKSHIRIQAIRRPQDKEIRALQELFEKAYKYMADRSTLGSAVEKCGPSSVRALKSRRVEET